MFSLAINEHHVLRLPEDKDAQALFENVDRNRQYLRQFMPWVDYNTTVADALTFISECRKNYAEGEGFSCCIVHQGKIVGTVGFHHIDKLNLKTEIGYWLSQDSQGKGLMRESCKALIKYAFEELKLHRVEIRCAIDNETSQRIPESLGFTREGVLRGAMLLNGQFKDVFLYSLLNPN